jgi:hypothetical protein
MDLDHLQRNPGKSRSLTASAWSKQTARTQFESVARRTFRVIAVISLTVLALVSLAGILGVTSVWAAARYRASTTGELTLQISGVSATLPLYDPRPANLVSKTLFFGNAVTGEITLTLAISGTPPLTLTSGAAFQRAEQVFTFTAAPATQWITYLVGSAARSQYDAAYTVTDDSAMHTTVAISYLQDVTAPQMSNIVLTTTGANLAAVDATLYFTENSSGPFWIAGQAVDAGAGYSVTSFAPANLGCGGPVTPNPSIQTDWMAHYYLCSLTDGLTLTATSRDYLGNAALTVFTVTADSTPPSSSVTATVEQVIGWTPFALDWNAHDAGSGLYSITLLYQSDSGPWLSYTTTAAAGGHDSGAFVFTPPDNDLLARRIITYSFATSARDKTGNTAALPAVPQARVWVKTANLYLPVLFKNFPLAPQVTINNGAASTYRRAVTLVLTAALDGDTVDQVRFRNEGENWGSWQNFTTPMPFVLASGNGRKIVYAQFKSASGTVSAEGSGSILLFENGDFEQDLAIGWNVENGGLSAARVSATSDGTSVAGRAALLGNTGYPCNAVPTGYAGVAQTLRVPSDGGKLKFKYFMLTQDGAPLGSTAYDDFEVWIGAARIYSDANRVTTGLLCSLWWRIPGASNPRPDPAGQTSGWYEKTIDLGSYTSQSIVIAFRNYSRYDNLLNTYTYLDEVRLEPE